MDHEPVNSLALGIAALGIDVVRFEFPYMQANRVDGARRLPDSDEVLRTTFASVVAELRHPGKLCLGGYSLGARIATQIAPDIDVAGLVCVGFPFHPKGAPKDLSSTNALVGANKPTLVLQGSRDSFGNREQIKGYNLPKRVQLHWIEDANHALEPRKASEETAAQIMGAGIEAIQRFILAL